jgi:hypothetical protein
MPTVPLLTYYSRYRRRMVERADGERRRRRVRGARSGQPAPAAAPAIEPAATPHESTAPAASAAPSPARSGPVSERPSDTRRRRPDHGREREPYDSHLAVPAEDHERGLRGLIGGGSSQVSVEAAMRARDSARPTDADIAHAEETLTIVHRGWVPRDT